MFFEPSKNDHGLPYNPIKAFVVPRPIGWITTVNKAGDVNVAPFSFFNILSYHPPICLFSAGGHADDHEDKDTIANIKKTGEFVYNMAWVVKFIEVLIDTEMGIPNALSKHIQQFKPQEFYEKTT